MTTNDVSKMNHYYLDCSRFGALEHTDNATRPIHAKVSIRDDTVTQSSISHNI